MVHEFKNGVLTDARLIQRNTTIEGKLADEQTLANINADLASGELKLRRPQEFRTPTSITPRNSPTAVCWCN